MGIGMLLLCHDLEVGGVYAPPDLTGVMEEPIGRDWPNELFVNESMGYTLTRSDAEVAVAATADLPAPRPTLVGTAPIDL